MAKRRKLGTIAVAIHRLDAAQQRAGLGPVTKTQAKAAVEWAEHPHNAAELEQLAESLGFNSVVSSGDLTPEEIDISVNWLLSLRANSHGGSA